MTTNIMNLMASEEFVVLGVVAFSIFMIGVAIGHIVTLVSVSTKR